MQEFFPIYYGFQSPLKAESAGMSGNDLMNGGRLIRLIRLRRLFGLFNRVIKRDIRRERIRTGRRIRKIWKRMACLGIPIAGGCGRGQGSVGCRMNGGRFPARQHYCHHDQKRQAEQADDNTWYQPFGQEAHLHRMSARSNVEGQHGIVTDSVSFHLFTVHFHRPSRVIRDSGEDTACLLRRQGAFDRGIGEFRNLEAVLDKVCIFCWKTL